MRAPAWTDDRVAVTALFLAAIAYGIQSLLDWTWFVPGPTVMALVAAGFVAGRGPAPEAAAPAEAPAARARLRERGSRLPCGVLAALRRAWNIWQPERADGRADDAIALAAKGDIDEALEAAHDAQDIDPLAIKPLFAEAAVTSAPDATRRRSPSSSGPRPSTRGPAGLAPARRLPALRARRSGGSCRGARSGALP